MVSRLIFMLAEDEETQNATGNRVRGPLNSSSIDQENLGL
jgi:hypothetical protein